MAGRQQHHHKHHNLTVAKPSSSSSRVRDLIAAAAVPSASVLEERVAIQHREIHALVVDNQRLAASHAALKEDLAAAHLDLRSSLAAASDAKVLSDARLRDAFDRSLKADADARLTESAALEVDRVRADARKLAASRDDLAKELREADGDLAGAREGLNQVDSVKSEIESVRLEILRGRAAIEREKKTRAHNLEFRKVMEEKVVSMAAELEKLHAELVNADRRARAASAAAKPDSVFGEIPFKHDMVYGGKPYSEPYNIHQGSGDTQKTTIFR